MTNYAETRLQMASSDYLNGIIRNGSTTIKVQSPFPGLLFTHPANETSDAKEAFWALRKGQKAGTPDWLFWWIGEKAAIEMKVDNRPLSYEQKKWRNHFEETGGKYAICQKVVELRDALISWGLECRNMLCIEPQLSLEERKRMNYEWQRPR